MKALKVYIIVLVTGLIIIGCSMEIRKPEIFKNAEDSIKEPVTEESLYKCSGEFYEGSYYEYLDPYDQMRWMSGLTVHIENMDDYGFDIYVTDDSPDGGGKIILEQRRAEFAATGYEAVCKGDSEPDYFEKDSQIRVFLIETGEPAAVTTLVLSGFEPCRWKLFVNNTIPGHQFN